MVLGPMFCVICGGWFEDIVDVTEEMALHGQTSLRGSQTEVSSPKKPSTH